MDPGKRPGGAQGPPKASPAKGPDNTKLNLIMVSVIRTNSAIITGLVGGAPMEIMLDSGSAVSLITQGMISPLMTSVIHIPLPQVKLVTAAGNDLLIVDHIQAAVQIQNYAVTHSFIVVNTLITPAILGIDFLQQHGIKIDFVSTPIKLSSSPGADNNIIDPCVRSVMEADYTQWTKHRAIISLTSTIEDQVEDYAILVFSDEHSLEFPVCKISDLQPVVYEFQ